MYLLCNYGLNVHCSVGYMNRGHVWTAAKVVSYTRYTSTSITATNYGLFPSYTLLHDHFPPKCCYFVVVGGLVCLADPRGYASWCFDSWLVQPCWTGSGLEARLNATHRWCWQHQCLVGYIDDLVMWWLSQSPGWTSHGPVTRNAWVMSGTISHAGTHYSLM